MDVDKEKMKSLGIFGREAIKIINKWRRVFTLISPTLFLPLYLLLLAYFKIWTLVFGKIFEVQYSSKIDFSDIIYLQIFILAYLFLSIILSVLAPFAIVYSVACAGTTHDVTFKQVLRVVPKVWRRFLITHLCVSSFFFVAFITFFLILFVIFFKYGGDVIFMFLPFFMFLAALYFCIIWQLWSVVSVLEDLKGLKAMANSKQLLKGKMLMASGILILLSFTPFAIQHVLLSISWGVVSRVILGIAGFQMFPLFYLLSLVTETVLYFECKSYHNEDIDKSIICFEMEEYDLLKVKEVHGDKLGLGLN